MKEWLTMKTVNCEFAIIGAGPAGMAAAVQAAQAGIQVSVFEKSGKVGGLRDGGIGPFAVESSLQERQFVDLSKTQAFEYLMEFTHWTTNARLVSEYINQSGETIDWLESLGVNFGSVSAYYKGGMATQHNIGGRKITDVLLENAKALGVQFFMNTSVTKLQKENNAIIGFSAIGEDQEPLTVQADAVLVSTGGFAGNAKMVKDIGYTQGVDIMYTFDMGINNGEGVNMIWDVGGAKTNMMMDTYVGLTAGYGGPRGTAPALACLREPVNLMVNQKGLRFMREDLCENPGYTGNAVHSQYKGCAISIVDATMYQEYLAQSKDMPMGPPPGEAEGSVHVPEPFERFNGIPMEDILQDARSNGCDDFFLADSLEEFAQQAGIPFHVLTETITEYNEMCQQREDPIFHKAPQYLHPIDMHSAKYYGARFFCDTYGGLGGVKINHKAQVLDINDDPIPGLYCAGNDANTIYGGSYPFYLCGNTSSFALNTGRLAAKDFIRSKHRS
jgi:fumarate reductase flavoprotein subunit